MKKVLALIVLVILAIGFAYYVATGRPPVLPGAAEAPVAR